MFAVYAFQAYLLTGFLYALYFAFWRVNKIDAGAAHASWKFRLLIIPGSTVLWPYLLLKKFPTNDTAA
jgi:hypothetical protein